MNQLRPQNALARIQGGAAYPDLRGTVQFAQQRAGTLVTVRVTGLPETETGFFALHIHTGGSCQGADFSETGGHFDPANAAHPNHAGDLPPLLDCHGTAYLRVLTDRFPVAEVVGRTVVIHKGPDDFTTQPAGNAGEKIACGVIRRV